MTPEQISQLRREKYNATVLSLHKVHSDLMLLRVKPDTPRALPIPGQYTTLGLGYWEPRHPGCQEENPLTPAEEARIARRSYSISCPVLDDSGKLIEPSGECTEFYIVLVRKSSKDAAPVLTPRLFMLRPGDRLHLGEKITGHYTLAGVKPDDTVVFLSTGTGEAPHNYMLWELLRREHRGRILAVCCVRYSKDLGYLPTHQELMRRYPNYVYRSLTTREHTEMGGKKYIQDLFMSGDLEQALGKALDPASTHVFLCGNPSMIGIPEKVAATGGWKYPETKGMIELLNARGFIIDQPKKVVGNIHYEKYW